jgi:hypothetical protein
LKGESKFQILKDKSSPSPLTGEGEGDKFHKVSREQELNNEGWEKRFTIDEPRLSEMVKQYKELGFEVLLEPVDTSSEECTACITAFHDRYKTIYTRRKK